MLYIHVVAMVIWYVLNAFYTHVIQNKFSTMTLTINLEGLGHILFLMLDHVSVPILVNTLLWQHAGICGVSDKEKATVTSIR